MRTTSTDWHSISSYALKYVERYQRDVPQLEREQKLLLKTLAQAWHKKEYASVVRLATSLCYLAGRFGKSDTGRHILLWGIYACQQVQDWHCQAHFLNRLSGLLHARGEFAYAQQMWEKSLELSCAQGCFAHLWEPLSSFVYTYDILKGYGHEILLRFVEDMIHRRESDQQCLAVALFIRGFHARLAGATELADKALQDCLDLLATQRLGTSAYECFFELEVRTELARVHGDYTHAQEYSEAAVSLASIFCDYYTIAALLLDQAWFAYQKGMVTDARTLALRMLSLARQIESSHYYKCGMSLLHQINTQKALPLVSVIPLTPNLTTISSEREDTTPHQIEIGVHQPPQSCLLSRRELEVLQLVAEGLSNTEIAARLVITTGTVKKHLEHIFSKLDTHSRTQAVARARNLSLLR
jgi:ATP/maltotriose-dependent transcriptional regulator MalT